MARRYCFRSDAEEFNPSDSWNFPNSAQPARAAWRRDVGLSPPQPRLIRTFKNPGRRNRQKTSVIKARKAAARAQALTNLQDFNKTLVEEVAGAVLRVIHAECRAVLAEDRAAHAEEALASCAAALAEMKKQVAYLESLRTPPAAVVVEVQPVVSPTPAPTSRSRSSVSSPRSTPSRLMATLDPSRNKTTPTLREKPRWR